MWLTDTREWTAARARKDGERMREMGNKGEKTKAEGRDGSLVLRIWVGATWGRRSDLVGWGPRIRPFMALGSGVGLEFGVEELEIVETFIDRSAKAQSGGGRTRRAPTLAPGSIWRRGGPATEFRSRREGKAVVLEDRRSDAAKGRRARDEVVAIKTAARQTFGAGESVIGREWATKGATRLDMSYQRSGYGQRETRTCENPQQNTTVTFLRPRRPEISSSAWCTRNTLGRSKQRASFCTKGFDGKIGGANAKAGARKTIAETRHEALRVFQRPRPRPTRGLEGHRRTWSRANFRPTGSQGTRR
ncbi:hypothetical protein B0H16DRAFT_1471661 [Mycena metata]|uniref:Uncharacterized protein n=1 Tax=Mycena metata TaxID=1033252 RepID=A0AAD7HQ72_9AGAR|nr:hypothetical protein B0H16DRAFT_1471661 [Mycena metata]